MAAYGSAAVKMGAAPAANCTVNQPSGLSNGDFLICFLTLVGAAIPTVTAPSGWTLIRQFTNLNNGATLFANFIYSKIASGEPASWTWTFTSMTSEATVVRCTGATGTITPALPTALNTTGLGVDSSTTATGLTTPNNNTLVIYFGQDSGDVFATLTAPGGTTPTFTERVTVPTTVIQSIATGVLATAGATGNKNQGCNSSVPNTRGAVLVSVQDGVPPATFTYFDMVLDEIPRRYKPVGVAYGDE